MGQTAGEAIRPPSSTPALPVSIVIVTHNNWPLTERCLKSLSSVKCQQVIVVDNASTDMTCEGVAQFEDVLLVMNSRNQGYSHANNLGVELAETEYVMLLNNDALLTEGSVEVLVETLKRHPRAVAVQPMILLPDGTIDSVGSFMTKWGFLLHWNLQHNWMPSVPLTFPVFSLKGACMLWRREAYMALGGLDESFFLYNEETELCHRAHSAGHTVMCTTEAVVIHENGASTKLSPLNIDFLNYRNKTTTLVRHLPIGQLCTIGSRYLVAVLALVLTSLVKDPALSASVMRGTIVGLTRGLRTRGLWTKRRVPLVPGGLKYLRMLNRGYISRYQFPTFSMMGIDAEERPTDHGTARKHNAQQDKTLLE